MPAAVAADIGGGLVHSPQAILRGVSNAIASTGHGIADLLDGKTYTKSDGTAGKTPSANLPMQIGATGLAWLGDKISNFIPEPKTVTGNLIQDVTQFSVGIVGMGKVIELPAAAGVVGKVAMKLADGAIKNFGAAATVFQGQQQKLSDLVEAYPALRNPVTAYLASNKDDTEAEGRFKNGLEGVIAGGMADVMFLGVKALKYATVDRPVALAATKEAADTLERLKAAGQDADAAVPSTSTSILVDGSDAPKITPVDGVAPAPNIAASAESAPKVTGDAAAPYSTDLPMVPARDATGAVMPGNTLADAAEVQKALNARWAVAGKEMAETGRFNPRTINAPEDLHAMVNATIGATEKNLNKFVGGNADGVVTHAMTEAEAQAYVKKMAPDLADMSGQSEANLIINMAQDAKTTQGLAARLHAYKQIMLSIVNDAGENASKALALDGTPESIKAGADALHSAHIASQVLAMVKSIDTNVARTQSAQRITKGLNSKLTEDWGYQHVAQKLEAGLQHADDQALLRNLASMKDNPKGFNQYLTHTFGEKVSGAFNSWYMNALLSSPKTHAANFISNTASTLYQPLERAVAGVMPAQWGEVGPKMALRRFADEYTGMGLGLMDSFRAAREAFKLGRSQLDPQGGTHIDSTGKAVDGLSARALGLTHDYTNPRTGELIRTDTTPVLSMFADGFSNTVGMPSRLLTTGDELFKQINYRGYLYSRAAESAREGGLTGKAFADHVSAKMDEGFAAPGSNFPEGSGTNKKGLQVAREATFTQPLDYGVSRWIQGMGNEPGAGGVMTKLVVPFVRTPVNLLRFSWRHTPGLQAFEVGFKRDFAAGGEARAKAQAQIVTGMGMSVAAGSLAYQGVITGGFSLNPEVRKAEEATGAKEYAVKIGDKYYQYNRLDPFGTILGLHADFMKLTDHLSQFESDKLAYGMSLSLAKNLASKTYLQGLTNAFASLGDLISGKSETGFDTFAYRLAGSVMVPSVVNAFKGDDTLREIRSVMDSYRSRMPGSSQQVPPVHNVLGEVVQAPVGWGPDAFSPIGYGQMKHDAVYDEMARQVSQNDHPLNRIMPKLGDTDIDLREVTLKSGQNAYDRMQDLLWKSGVKDTMRQLFESPMWKSGDLRDAGQDYPSAQGTKIYYVNKVLEDHKQIARNQLLAENPELLSMYTKERTRMGQSGAVGEGPRVYLPPTFLQSLVSKPKNVLK